MSNRNISWTLIVFFTLNACAPPSQRSANAIAQTTQSTTGELIACKTSVYEKPVYGEITPNLASPANNFVPSSAQMVNEKKPTAAESRLLIAYSDEIILCGKQAVENMRRVSPAIADVMEEANDRTSNLFLQLIRKQISWGGAARQSQKNLSITKAKMAVVTEKIDRDLEAQHREELAAQEKASKDFNDWLVQRQTLENQRQLIDALNRPQMTNTMPTTTNCHNLGYGAFNCSTW